MINIERTTPHTLS